MSMTELQRIGRILGIKADVDDKTMCLLIQDKIKEKDKQVKEKTFSYYMVKAQNEKLSNQVHNLQNEFAESIGIQEYMMVKNSRDNYKKNNKTLLEENYNLRKSIELYRANDLRNKIKVIEGVR